MKKKIVAFVLSIFLLSMSSTAFAANVEDRTPAQEDSSIVVPFSLNQTTIRLSKSSTTSLQIYVFGVSNSTKESIFISAYLQQYSNGSWKNHSGPYTAYGKGSALLTHTVSPPRGYSYRVIAVISPSLSSPIERTSSTVYLS